MEDELSAQMDELERLEKEIYGNADSSTLWDGDDSDDSDEDVPEIVSILIYSFKVRARAESGWGNTEKLNTYHSQMLNSGILENTSMSLMKIDPDQLEFLNLRVP